jgi:hypothetical protein
MKIISAPSRAHQLWQCSSYPALIGRKFQLMAEQDPRAKYRVLPPNVDVDDTVVEVDTELTDVEHGGRPDYNSGADPYLRITGWLPT